MRSRERSSESTGSRLAIHRTWEFWRQRRSLSEQEKPLDDLPLTTYPATLPAPDIEVHLAPLSSGILSIGRVNRCEGRTTRAIRKIVTIGRIIIGKITLFCRNASSSRVMCTDWSRVASLLLPGRIWRRQRFGI
jgi:hypothetical protein